MFAKAYIPFAGALLASAPEPHQEVLLASLAALPADLKWFREKATERGLDLKNTGRNGVEWDRQHVVKSLQGNVIMCPLHHAVNCTALHR